MVYRLLPPLYHKITVPTSTSTVWPWILDALFPRRCLFCQILLHTVDTSSYLCAVCLEKTPLDLKTACAFCNAPTVGGVTCPFCRKAHALDRLLVATTYSRSSIERVVKAAKYRFVHNAAHDMASLMLRYLEEKKAGKLLQSVSLIIPIPLHPQRLRWRGFNQSEIMARDIGTKLNIPVATDAIVRVRHTIPQADIKDRQSRIENARGLFVIQSPDAVRGKSVLLIDDLSTTGSTLNEAARVLKDAGAIGVSAFVFARG